MRLKVLGSNSKRNCYLLENSNSALVIECGVKFSELKKIIGFDISKICGAIISHSHGDHCKHVKEFLKAGIKVYADQQTIMEINHPSHNWKFIDGKLNIGDFEIIPFDLVHSVKNSGFLIRHPDTGVFCFFTDTHYCPNRFSGLNNIIVECNYDLEILENNIENHKLSNIVRNQVLMSHFSLDSCIEFLKANNLSKVNNIVLIHLSDGNSNADEFKRKISELTGKNVFIAQKGLNIEFNKSPF